MLAFLTAEIIHWLGAGLLAAIGVYLMIQIPTRFGMLIGVTFIGIAAGLVAYDAGYRSGHDQETLNKLRETIAEQDELILQQHQQAADSAKIAADAAKREQAATELSARLQQEVDDYAEHLDPNAACLATDADVRGMRAIGTEAGQAGAAKPPADVRHAVPDAARAGKGR